MFEEADGIALQASCLTHENDFDPVVVETFKGKRLTEQAVVALKRLKVDPTVKVYHVDNVAIPSRPTLKKYHKALKLRIRKSQSLTLARKAAQCDIRLIYSTAVFIWALANQKPSNLIWNVDATTFECSPKGTGQQVIVFRPTRCPSETSYKYIKP